MVLRVFISPPDISALPNSPVKSEYSGRSIMRNSDPIFAMTMAESRSSYSLRRSISAVRTSSSGKPVLSAMSDMRRFSGLE